MYRFPSVPNPKRLNAKLSEILSSINNVGTRISLELSSNKPLDLNSVLSVNSVFYSITWHTKPSANYSGNLSDMPEIQLTSALADRTKCTVLHLACRHLSKENIYNILSHAERKGIKNILAMWGEQVPMDETRDFLHAADLVSYIKQKFRNIFCVGVLGYPSANFNHLKEKVDAGADFIITQTFFETDTFYKFYRSCRNKGIHVPIIPGLHIMNSYEKFLGITYFCNAPTHILSDIESIKSNKSDVRSYGIQHITGLLVNLLTNKDHAVPCVHIFCDNDTEFVKEVFENVMTKVK